MTIALLVFAAIFRINGFPIYEYDPYKAVFSPVVVFFSVYLFIIFEKLNIAINLSKIAGLTYYVYLLHTPILLIICRTIIREVNSLFKVIILTVVTVLVSFAVSIVYRFVCNRVLDIVKHRA